MHALIRWHPTHRLIWIPADGEVESVKVMACRQPYGLPSIGDYWLLVTEADWLEQRDTDWTLHRQPDGTMRPSWKGLPTPYCQMGELVVEDLRTGRQVVRSYTHEQMQAEIESREYGDRLEARARLPGGWP